MKVSNISADVAVVGPQPDPRCTVTDPVRLTEATLGDGTSISFPDRPLIACAMAETFSAFARQLLAPLAKGTYGTAVKAVWTGPGLECRTRDHIVGAKLSAHGQGLAIDIAQIELADGRRLSIDKPQTETDRAFEAAARAGGCGYFHTVLGPGTDVYHESHWHFDLLPRGSKGDSKVCE